FEVIKTKNNISKSTLTPFFWSFLSVDNSMLMWISMWISGKKRHIYAKFRRKRYVDNAIIRLVYICAGFAKISRKNAKNIIDKILAIFYMTVII
ncbi:MAG: hypothetical protein K2I23_00165, partial [Clostridia bacterium]|nr:hypothetical protein [Clostridia bacterium]